MGRPSDIIVVGAGVVGCAIAHELARRGASVEVVDDRPVGMGATQASAGILAPFIEAREDSPLLEPVRESFRTGKSLVWNRVNDLPDFVYFDHSIHVNKGVGCNTCHGAVDRMPLMFNHASLQMEWCIQCHRAPEKNLRPRDQVFNMRYQQPTTDSPVVVDGTSYTDQLSLGKHLVHKYDLRTVMDITSCSTCHR